MDRYSIVTGFWSGKGETQKAEFFDLWWRNTMKFANPVDTFVINAGSDTLPDEKRGKWIDLSFNLGHVHDLDVNDYPNKKFGGWSLAFMMGGLLCYANNSDFIFKEQDCLAFGNWIKRMYEDLARTDSAMVVGRSCDSDGQGLEQSLMLIRHDFILPFIQAYMAAPGDDGGDNFTRPEQKFVRLIRNVFPSKVTEMSFGFGRARPAKGEAIHLPYYFQKITEPELEGLQQVSFLW